MNAEGNRTQRLIDLYFDEMISQEEMAELETLIQESPEAGEIFCEQADLQVMLHRVVVAESESAATESRTRVIPFPPLPLRTWLSESRTRKVMAFAASVLVILSISLVSTSTHGDDEASLIPMGPGVRLDRNGNSISVTNKLLLQDNDRIYVATNSQAQIYWNDSCKMALDGCSETQYDRESVWYKKLHKVLVMLGKTDVEHSESKVRLHVGTPGIKPTRIKNSKVTFVVGPEHTHVKVDHGHLTATASKTGEKHKLSAGDEVVILHEPDDG